MGNEIVLFDLASRFPSCWSSNTWKARLVLNFKNLPYRTEWVAFQDIPKFKALGIPPNPPRAWSQYSVPIIQLPDSEYVMDSLQIAKRLESIHPEPSLHLESGFHDTVRKPLGEIFNPVIYEFMLLVRDNLLEEPTKTWFHDDRRRHFGATLDELVAQKASEEPWEISSRPACSKLKDILTAHKKDDGPFILGSSPCFGDFVVVAVFESMKRVTPDRYEQLMNFDPSFKRLHEACHPWLEKDGDKEVERRERLWAELSPLSQPHFNRQAI